MYGSKSSKVHLLQQIEERRLKTNLETIVENQIVEDFFIDFTVPFSCVVRSVHWRLIGSMRFIVWFLGTEFCDMYFS